MRSILRLLFIISTLVNCNISTVFSKDIKTDNYVIKIRSNRKPQTQFTCKNTIYVINKKINLRGQVIEIPSGSTLLFKRKGKLYNGTIIGNLTQIDAPKRTVFEDVEIERGGSWCNTYGYPEWFGAKNTPSFDSKLAIQKAIDVSDTCVLSQHYYTSYDTKTHRGDNVDYGEIEIANKVLKGLEGNLILIDSKYSNTEKTTVFYIGSNVLIDGINIEYYNEDHSGWTGTQAGVYRIYGGNVTVRNTSLKGAMAAWINLIGAPGRVNYTFTNNRIHDCDCGVIIQGDQHSDGEVYPIKLLIDNNIVVKEKERHSEFVVFWGSCKDGGRVYYSDVIIKNNFFGGGYLGGCITGHPLRCGLQGITIVDNTFYDCGACSFYNVKGLVYLHNHVTGSSFIRRQSEGILGSYPDLTFVNCTDCHVDDNSCFGLTIKDCEDLRIGKLKQTLCLSHTDSLILKNNDYITNFIGVAAYNSTVSIDELTINPFNNKKANSDICRYYIHKGYGATINVGKVFSSIPIQVSQNKFKIEKLYFVPGDNKLFYIDTTRQ